MVPTLLAFVGGRSSLLKYIGIGLVLAFVMGTIYYYKSDNEKLVIENEKYKIALVQSNINLDAAVLKHKQNIDVFDKYKQDTKDLLSLLNTRHKKDLFQAKQIQIIKERVIHVEPKDNAPTAVILKSTIYRLWQLKDNWGTKINYRIKNRKTSNTRWIIRMYATTKRKRN